MKPRARTRVVALVTAGLFSVLFPMHFAVIPHGVCPEHGEISKGVDDHDHHGSEAPEPVNDDEHCPAAALLTAPGLYGGADLAALDVLPDVELARLPEEATRPHLSYEILAVSPSNSPPRAA